MEHGAHVECGVWSMDYNIITKALILEHRVPRADRNSVSRCSDDKLERNCAYNRDLDHLAISVATIACSSVSDATEKHLSYVEDFQHVIEVTLIEITLIEIATEFPDCLPGCQDVQQKQISSIVS